MKEENIVVFLFWITFVYIPIGCGLAFIWDFGSINLLRISITSLAFAGFVLLPIIITRY